MGDIGRDMVRFEVMGCAYGKETLLRPCVDGGLITGSFCDFCYGEAAPQPPCAVEGGPRGSGPSAEGPPI